MLSSVARSCFVFARTCLKQAEQKRLEFENDSLGFGISKQCSPLTISPPQPLHSDFLPAIADAGRPAEPLISDGMLLFDIFEFLYFSRQTIKNL